MYRIKLTGLLLLQFICMILSILILPVAWIKGVWFWYDNQTYARINLAMKKTMAKRILRDAEKNLNVKTI
jgi:hypothetical protein